MSDERELIGDGFDPRKTTGVIGPDWDPILVVDKLPDWPGFVWQEGMSYSDLAAAMARRPKGSLWSRIRTLPYTLPTRIWLWRMARDLRRQEKHT